MICEAIKEFICSCLECKCLDLTLKGFGFISAEIDVKPALKMPRMGGLATGSACSRKQRRACSVCLGSTPIHYRKLVKVLRGLSDSPRKGQPREPFEDAQVSVCSRKPPPNHPDKAKRVKSCA